MGTRLAISSLAFRLKLKFAKDICDDCKQLVRTLDNNPDDLSPLAVHGKAIVADGRDILSYQRRLKCHICTYVYHEGILPPGDELPKLKEYDANAEGRLMAHLPSIINGDLLRGNTSFPSITLLHGWLNDCRNGHEKCRSTGTKEESELPYLNLIDCSTLKILRFDDWESIPYLALSYVWGPPNPNRKNHGEVPDSLNEGSIPRTIMDAIFFTKYIGFKYLWVDRYCIPQDPEHKDKVIMLQNMNFIYERAEAAVIALEGMDDNAGLAGISVPKAVGNVSMIGCKVFRPWPERLENSFKNSKWATRGWTFQEAVLAKRAFYITSSGVFLVCQQDVRGERYPNCSTDSGGIFSPSLFGGLGDAASSGRRPVSRPNVVQWIELYCKRELTFPGDAVNAFRGVLQRVQEYSWWGVPILDPSYWIDAPGQQALHSHYSREELVDLGFILGLSWHTDTDHGGDIPARTRRNDNFPTWSWASLRRNTRYSLTSDPGGMTDLIIPSIAIPYEDPFISLKSFIDTSESKLLPETFTEFQVTGRIIRVSQLKHDQIYPAWIGSWHEFNALKDDDDAEALVLYQFTDREHMICLQLMTLKWVSVELGIAERMGRLFGRQRPNAWRQVSKRTETFILV